MVAIPARPRVMTPRRTIGILICIALVGLAVTTLHMATQWHVIRQEPTVILATTTTVPET